MNNRLNKVMRALLAMAVVMGLSTHLLTSSASAQGTGLVDDSTYVSVATGERYTWSSDWEYSADNSTAERDGEIISLTGDLASILFSYFPVGIDMNSARDDLLEVVTGGADAFAGVDRGSYNNVSYSLDKVLYEDVELGVFTLFIERESDVFVTVVIAGAPIFDRGIASAQSDIQIDGAAILPGIEPAGLQSALDASDPLTTSSKPRATDEPEDVPTEEPVEEETPTTEPDDEPNGNGKVGGSGQDVSDWEDLGVVEDGLYQSPQYGAEVTWSSDWIVSEVSDDPVTSDDKTATDTILLNPSENASVSGIVIIKFFPNSGSATTEDVLDTWTSADFTEDGAQDVLLSDATKQEAGVVLLGPIGESEDVVQYYGAFFLDRGDTSVVIQVLTPIDAAADTIASVQDGITIEGDPVLTIFSADDVQKALGD